MRFDVITLFPEMVRAPAGESILGRAREAGRIELRVHDPRDFAEGRHRQCDDAPFGGGDGMVMKPEPLARAIRAVKAEAGGSRVALLSPQGRRLDHRLAAELAALPGLILVCGHYAGVDERVIEALVELEISIGDYVLSGGELPALVVIDAVARLLPGVLGNQVSAQDDSFPSRLEHPQYTRPAEFEGRAAPAVLISGHHEQIRKWRKQKRVERTLARRPDLFALYPPDEEEREMILELEAERESDGGQEDQT